MYFFREVQDNKKFKPCEYCHQLKEDKSLAKHQKICLNNPDRVSTPRRSKANQADNGKQLNDHKEQTGGGTMGKVILKIFFIAILNSIKQANYSTV